MCFKSHQLEKSIVGSRDGDSFVNEAIPQPGKEHRLSGVRYGQLPLHAPHGPMRRITSPFIHHESISTDIISSSDSRNKDMMEQEVASKSIAAVCSTVLDLPPSCVEFSPLYPEYFVVGTYNLEKEDAPEKTAVDDADQEATADRPVGLVGAHRDEKSGRSTPIPEGSDPKKPQSRNGSLILYRIVEDELSLIQTVSYPSAILDLHFAPKDQNVFAIASSTGSISLFSLMPGLDESLGPNGPITHTQCSIKFISTHSLFPPDTLILSFSWCPYSTNSLAVTLSTGEIHYVTFSTDINSDVTDIRSIHKSEPLISHELEAWCSAFSPTMMPMSGALLSCSIYSGGDDGKLRLVSLQNSPENENELVVMPTSHPTVFSGHEAGVTAVLPLPMQTSPSCCMLLTGSYDDYVRVYATHDFRPYARNANPKVLKELYIGGGVWRLKFLQDYSSQGPVDPDLDIGFRVLASCMHAGARILEVKGNQFGEWSIEVLGSVETHQSMCYGSDVQPLDPEKEEEEDEKRLCVSTSFYDRLLCVWTFDPRAT